MAALARTLIKGATIVTMDRQGDLPVGDILVTGDRDLLALRGLVGDGHDLPTLRENLCQAIRFGEIDLHSADLHAYLRQSVYAQVMIDQPGYAGAVEAGKRLT